MRNFDLGVPRRDLVLFGAAAILALVLTLLWHLFLEGPISGAFPQNSQIANKYFLTFVMYVLAFAIALVSLLIARRAAGAMGRASLIANFLVRFGLALQLFGILITPIGLIYASDPTRSVPVGFTFFTTAFVGLFVAGIGANMLVPRRT